MDALLLVQTRGIRFTTVVPQDDGASGIDNHGFGGRARWDIALSLKMPNISMSVIEQHDSDVRVSRSGETGGLLARRYIWVDLGQPVQVDPSYSRHVIRSTIHRRHERQSSGMFTEHSSTHNWPCAFNSAQHSSSHNS